jgi:hypothetical protein
MNLALYLAQSAASREEAQIINHEKFPGIHGGCLLAPDGLLNLRTQTKVLNILSLVWVHSHNALNEG